MELKTVLDYIQQPLDGTVHRQSYRVQNNMRNLKCRIRPLLKHVFTNIIVLSNRV